MTGKSRPRSPGVAIEPVGDAKLAAHPAGKYDGLECIEQDRQEDDYAGDDGKNLHSIR